jgi:hypothetical protein
VPRPGVKQYVAEVHGDRASFRVFTTDQAGVYLFDLLDRDGCSTTLQTPVRAADLRPELRRALRHGWGLTTAAGARRLAKENRLRPAETLDS